MNELLQSVKSDLLSRRLLPLLVVVCLGLFAALAYGVLGGKEEAKPPAPVAAAPLPSGLPVTVAPPNATAAASETPAGSRYQTHGPSRDPFLPLPGAVKTTSTGAGGASSGTTGATAGKSTTAPSGGSTGGAPTTQPKAAPAPAPKKTAPKPPTNFKPRPDPLYSVSVLFGLVPANPEQQPALTPFEDMLLYEPLPSAKTPLIVFIGVTKVGEKAAFALIVPPILRGPAVCAPSQAQCQAIELAAGQSEELEYVKTNGEAVDFDLKIVKISKRSGALGASAKARRVSKAGRLALSRAGLLAFR